MQAKTPTKNIVNWARSGIIEILCGRDLSKINMDPQMNALGKKTLLLLDIMARFLYNKWGVLERLGGVG